MSWTAEFLAQWLVTLLALTLAGLLIIEVTA